GFIFLNEELIYMVYKVKIVSRRMEGFILNYEFNDVPLILSPKNCDDRYLYDNTKKLGFFKFDLKKGKILRVSSNEKLNGLIKIIGDYLIHYQSGSINLYDKTDFF